MSIPEVDRSGSVIAAVCLSFIAVSAFLVLPLFVGAAATGLELTESQVGFLASAIMSGSALSSILAVLWIRRVDWRRAAYLALGTLLAAHLISLWADSFRLLLACQLVAGLGGGAAYSLALTALSDNRHADRCFGFSIAAQVAFQVIGMLALPVIVSRFGLNGILVVFISLAGAGLLIVSRFPRAGVEQAARSAQRYFLNTGILAALAGCFFFFFNVGVVWTYVERIAVTAQFDPEFIGTALAVGVAAGVPGALVASSCGERFGRVAPLALGAVGTLVALGLLDTTMSTEGFVLSMLLYNFAWNFSLAFQYAAVNAADDSGRSVAAAPALHAAGGAVGPGVAAFFVSSESFAAINALAAAAVITSFALFALSAALRKNAARDVG